jgi:formylmethanofuran dehydrogenase subunit B
MPEVDGREVPFEEAVSAAATILREARAPLVCGLEAASCEAQRRAVALAEAFGAVIDSGAAPFAYQAIGASTATFGEIRRAELVVAMHTPLPDDLGVRSPVVVDLDFEALWELRARITGAPLRTKTPALEDLERRLRDARRIAFIHGPLDDLTALALHSLVRDLNRDRHAVTLALRDGNARGAEDVLAWQTGFTGAVSFARGSPREALGALDVDAALVLASDAVTVAPVPGDVQVAFATVEVPGTVHRMDGVPLPLRAAPAEGPSVEMVLAAIEGHA